MAGSNLTKRILGRYENGFCALGDAADALHSAADAVSPPVSNDQDGEPMVRLESPADYLGALAAVALRIGATACGKLSENGLTLIDQTREDGVAQQDAPPDSQQ